jgi:hypothetical protein
MRPSASNPTVSHSERTGCSVIFVLLWNAILIGGWYYLLETGRWKEAPVFLIVVTIPFAVIGLLFAWGSLVNIMGLANPRATIQLSEKSVSPGDELEVSWTFSGPIKRLKAVEIYIIGDIDSFKQTKSATEKPIRNFMPEYLLHRCTEPSYYARGVVSVVLPEAVKTRIETRRTTWKIQVRGSIALWPDAYVEEALDVLS